MFSKHKSVEDFYLSNIKLKLEVIQKELRHARVDNQHILTQLSLILHEMDIEKQADDYYQEHLDDNVSTSPQTEQKEHFEDKEGDIKWSSSQG